MTSTCTYLYNDWHLNKLISLLIMFFCMWYFFLGSCWVSSGGQTWIPHHFQKFSWLNYWRLSYSRFEMTALRVTWLFISSNVSLRHWYDSIIGLFCFIFTAACFEFVGRFWWRVLSFLLRKLEARQTFLPFM